MTTGPLSESLLQKWNHEIQLGNGNTVREALTQLQRTEIPRHLLSQVAQLAWRVGNPELGIFLLAPIIRPKAKSPTVATPEEKMEYAACMGRAGNSYECLELLNGLDTEVYPRALFYAQFPSITSWNYLSTIEPLTRFIRLKKTNEYEKLVGMVNLAAALVFCREFEKAKDLLRDLLYQCSLNHYGLLLTRSLEISAELHIEWRKWKEALNLLEEARKKMKDRDSYEFLFIDKFEAIANLYLNNGNPKSVAALASIKENAQKRKIWETVRDCDRHLAIFSKDESLLWKVYFGTPFSSYREKLLDDFGMPHEKIPRSYEWTLDTRSNSDTQVLNLTHATISGDDESIGVGSLSHKVLLALTKDHYRPMRLLSLHASLYPGEHFNPQNSPNRVYDALFRVRKTLKEKRVALSITESDNTYRIESLGPIRIQFQFGELLGERYAIEFETLRERFKEHPFSIKEAIETLNCPRRTALRILTEFVELKKAERSGKGPATTYRFAA